MALCKQCEKKIGFLEGGTDGLCPGCRRENIAAERENTPECIEQRRLEEENQRLAELAKEVMVTTETATNLPVAERLDIVTAECVFGLNLIKDMFSATRDIFGGRNASTQKALREARKFAIDELRKEAALVGADAVVGVDLDYSEFSGGGKSMLFLVASGTAVTLKP